MTYKTINKLYEALLKNIENNPIKNSVFGEPITVITPNNNVSNLLKMKLADSSGVVVRINFITKEHFINSKIKNNLDLFSGFDFKYLRYHILNILNEPTINSSISSYYKDDFTKKYNYAKDLERAFIHYQNNYFSLFDEFNSYKLSNDIKNIYELQVLIYQRLTDKGFITLNNAINQVVGTDEEIHLIIDDNESALFNSLIDKFSNVTTYKLALNEANKPIKLFNNWSKIREMETIWDYITNTLETTDLLPSDILVLFPNVEEYITAINYVFSKKITLENRYQYSINNYVNEVLVFEQFLSRLRLEISYRLEANKIFDLFNLSLKIKGVEYDKIELNLIKDWISENGIRRENLEGEKNFDYSFLKGFEQLILGMMMKSGSFNHLDEYASVDISFNEYGILKRLYEFVGMIKKLSKANYTNLEELNNLILESLTLFFGESEDEDSILNKVIKLWLEIVNNQLIILHELPPVKVVLKILEEQVKLFKTQFLNSGGINFGNIKDFDLYDSKLKIVCGLDDNSFPQIKTESELNLDKEKEKKDINYQQTLFKNLVYNDTLTVLSYIGFNEANRKIINRSVFIDLFVKEKIIEINHKLHPFDKVYIHENSDDYYTYDTRYNVNELLEDKNPFVKKDYFEEGIYKNLNDLKRTVNSNVRNFFRNILKVSFPIDEELLKNSPLYFLETENRLEYSKIKNAILEDYQNLNNQGIKRLKAQGVIPYDTFGEIYINEFKTLYSEIVNIFSDHKTYKLIENLNIVYKDYFLNIPKIYYNVKEDNYLIVTSSTVPKQDKKRSKVTHYDFKVMFINYMFESILIKLVYNKDVKLVGFDKENGLVIYDKNILKIFNIRVEDEFGQRLLLEEKLEYFWSLKERLSTELYLFDLSLVSSIENSTDHISNLIDNIVNGVFISDNEKVEMFVNDFKEFEKALSVEESALEDYLKENTNLNNEDIIEVLNIIKMVEHPLKNYIDSFGMHSFGLKSYETHFQYLLDGVISVQTFVEKYGLMPLLKSYLLSVEVGMSAYFNEEFEAEE